MQIVDTEQLAELFGVSPATVRRWIDSGMPVLRPSPGVLRFDVQACVEWSWNRGETVAS